MKLANKVALITGAGSGFGRASALLFSREGARVAIADIDEKGGRETLQLLGNEGRAIFIPADVSVATQAEKMIKTTVETFGRLDILFNNAGMPMPMTPIENISEDLWDRIQDVNVKGIFLASKYAIPYLKKQGRGVILNTASIGGVRPRPGLGAYSVSKAAAIMLTKVLAIELAPSKIRVNCINPVAGETPMLAKIISARPLPQEKYEEEKQKLINTVPLGRLARAEDVAFAALFLVSDDASLITGASFDVDGGRSI